MKAIATLLLTFPLLAGAQVSPPLDQPPAPVQPAAPPPDSAPPPPPPSSPPPPPGQMEAPPAPTAPPQAESANAPPTDGQWVYTAQYGWVWMPYAQQYVYAPAGSAAPEMFVYYPAFGWRWVLAPWVWGLGAQPYWGVHGYVHFVWWGRGFGRWYAFAPRYAHWGGRYYWGGGHWVAPSRHYAEPHVVARAPQHYAPHGWHGGKHRH